MSHLHSLVIIFVNNRAVLMLQGHNCQKPKPAQHGDTSKHLITAKNGTGVPYKDGNREVNIKLKTTLAS